jgi:uncharacterized membrane protein YcaP (DUF421 family)
MDAIVRAVVIYFFLLIVFRLAGKRTLSETTNFELVLLLIISEVTQEAMVDDDHSMTNAILLILTLVGTSVVLLMLKQRFPNLEKWLDGTSVVIIEDGKMHKDRMDKLRVDEEDILEAARGSQGLERLDQIKYAVVERSGQITIVPNKAA